MHKSYQVADSRRYQLIPRSLCFIFDGNRVLLLKGAPGKTRWPGLYNGVGGHMERGEDVLSSARREVEEETGLAGIDLRLCGIAVIDIQQGAGIGMFIFSGEYSGDEITESEEGMLEWVPVAEAGAYPLVEDLPVLIARVMAVRAGGPMFYAYYRYDESNRLVIRFAGE